MLRLGSNIQNITPHFGFGGVPNDDASAAADDDEERKRRKTNFRDSRPICASGGGGAVRKSEKPITQSQPVFRGGFKNAIKVAA